MAPCLKFGDSWCNDTKLLKEKMFNSFRNYFSYSLRKWIMDMDLKFKKIFKGNAEKLELSFTSEGIKEAIWSCDTNWFVLNLHWFI
ncbi:hypothetical protein J1N35_039419 [Gossypium stocksii]|uniref:RNA-directed DNA polymerase, eukaryota, reverse transcriptase zinc-binding domain protein n=1 Tax=Gossypium stocksii TaxID=47602 RepID=A0A9D3ZNV1_9ROSI|nr:hypothetical protein J1N35_039419 [Gossypium stocksii]